MSFHNLMSNDVSISGVISTRANL